MARHKENGVVEATPIINHTGTVRVRFLLTVCLEQHPVYPKGMLIEIPLKLAEDLEKEKAVERV